MWPKQSSDKLILLQQNNLQINSFSSNKSLELPSMKSLSSSSWAQFTFLINTHWGSTTTLCRSLPYRLTDNGEAVSLNMTKNWPTGWNSFCHIGCSLLRHGQQEDEEYWMGPQWVVEEPLSLQWLYVSSPCVSTIYYNVCKEWENILPPLKVTSL